ncbi:unnamed protein product [Calypogeia fissa]
MAQEVSTVKESFLILLVSFIGFLSAAMHYLYNLLACTAHPSNVPPVCFDSACGASVGEEVQSPAAAHWTAEPEVVNDFHDDSVDPPRRYYAVVFGRRPGIYTDWDVVKPLVEHFRGNLFQSFRTPREVEQWFARELAKRSR